jgi:cyanophycinase
MLHRTCLYLRFLALMLASPAHSAERPCPGAGHGKLLVHGGGGGEESYTSEGLRLCGVSDAKVVVVEYAMGPFDLAAEDMSDKGNLYYAIGRWTAAGATNVTVLDLKDEAKSLVMVRNADYIFFDGGDQSILVDWMNKYPTVMNAIRKRHDEGALIGGMSAGAAAMSLYMIRGAETATLTDLRSKGTLIIPGLGFWPEVITDQHFVKRQRWARLVSAVLDNPTFPGIALDEETAVVVNRRAGTFDVIGNGTVTVIDARHAKIGRAAKGKNWSARDLRMTILRAGDRFDWRRGRPLN